ncbi:uncharacterized protein LOC111086647 [Limulus polyphemus]|uniref:Uncharacterized protein LOC111086647 n=1 Tax=Limulus polyphemus TaxID=6850 RepID=A0ABM1SR09_LIMPO|nr:uncharacterized protein LOC111086647 [Limulus polyphemus]
MKTILVLCLCLSVVWSEPPGIPFCELNSAEMESFASCIRTNAGAWYMNHWDNCKASLLPGATDAGVLHEICKEEETGFMLAMCLDVLPEELQEKGMQIINKCMKEAKEA